VTTPRRGVKWEREIEDVAHLCGAEGIDRLRIVADHGQPGAVGLERQQDRRLQAVGVLVLVDEDVVEAATDDRSASSASETICAQ
jgi:hypothetical protein